MQVRNNYDAYWEGIDGKSYGSGVFNGDLGVIRKISDNEIEVVFDDEKIVKYESSVLEDLEHAYAITIHKSQGGEFPVVVMPITNGPPLLYTRNLLYTGVTRAKKMLIIVGKESMIRYMIHNCDTKSRNTGLVFKIKKYQELFNE
jgi:exodeoxyribonuclease V alpha subunit